MLGIDTTQYVLFSPSLNLRDKIKLVAELNQKTSGLFDADPLILPLADDVPAEFPRIQLKSKEDSYRLSVAKSRLDFAVIHRDGDEGVEFPDLKSIDYLSRIFEVLAETIKARIVRGALVNNWAVHLDQVSAAEYLRKKYIIDSAPISQPDELEVHYLRKATVSGFESNNWVRIRSARKASDPEDNRLVAVQMDINTLAEKEYDFTPDSLKSFLTHAANIMTEELHHHFPEERNAR